MSRTVRQRLGDVLDAVRKARAADDQLMEADRLGDAARVEISFDAVLMNLVVIGESLKAVPDAVLSLEPDVPWRDIKGMRDVVGHQYHRIVPAVVHATVRTSLDPLEQAVRRPLDIRLPGDPDSSQP